MGNAEVQRKAFTAVMAEKGFSINSWCNAAKVSEGSLRHFLNGDSQSLHLNTVSKLAEAAEVPMARLLGEKAPSKGVSESKRKFALDAAKGKEQMLAGLALSLWQLDNPETGLTSEGEESIKGKLKAHIKQDIGNWVNARAKAEDKGYSPFIDDAVRELGRQHQR